MSEFLDQLEAMFDLAPRGDDAGALRPILRALADAGARAAWLTGGDGRLLAAAGPDEGAPPELPAGLPLATAETGGWRHVAGPGSTGEAFWLTRIGPPDGDFVLVLATPGDGDLPRSASGPAWAALATVTARCYGLHAAVEQERCRSRQLLAEQNSLSVAHERIVSEVLREREQRLREKHAHIDELESEVERRSLALREALQKAEDASRSKSDFLANMSHEIRTPMTAILGFSETLTDETLTSDERREAVATIQRNGKQLLAIINDILDLSKIEAGRLVVEQIECDPQQIVCDAQALLGHAAASKKIGLRCEVDPSAGDLVRSDPTRLRQILINLVGNAVKFTHQGEVLVRLRQAPVPGGARPGVRTTIEVCDTGIGMTPEQAANLFQPFTQADTSTTRRYGGTGLGLAISARLARALDGNLSVESHPGQGSTFRLIFDADRIGPRPTEGTAAPAGPARGAAADASKTPLAGMRLLLAEDGPDNQRLISAVLRKAGAEMTVAENGRIAFETAKRAEAGGAPFDVILMDMQMPVLDGYGATRELRAAGYSRPIIALTAHAMASDRERCLQAGCTDYATKPIDRAALLQAILQAAGRLAADAPASDPQ